MRSVTNFTAREIKHPGEYNDKPSLTIPDQAISPQELLRRYATGQPLGLKNVEAVYDDDENFDVPEFYKMNKLDRLHILQNNTETVIEKRAEMHHYKQIQIKQQQAEQAEKHKQKTAEHEKQAHKSTASEATPQTK